MKKLALLLVGFLLGFLLCYFFFCGTDAIAEGDGAPPPKPSKGLISPTDISKFDQAFNTRHALIKRELGIDDNRSSWYSLDDVRKYLDYAEYQANNTTKYKMDGVRLYLGVNNGLTTLMFVPTSSQITLNNDNKSEGSMFNLSLKRRDGGGDIKSLHGLDFGQHGDPPSANYPQ